MTIRLPFDLDPMLKTYHSLAFHIGMLMGNAGDRARWFPYLCNKYINCHFSIRPKTMFDVYAIDKSLCEDDHIFEKLEFNIVNPLWAEMLVLSQEEFIFRIKKMLEHGRYICGLYNERYISAKWAYGQRDFSHDYVIYGYDDAAGAFYSAGYTKNEVYEEFLIPYTEYYNSVFQQGQNASYMRIMRYLKDCSLDIRIPVIAKELTHYLNATVEKTLSWPDVAYGVRAVEAMTDYMMTNEGLDIRWTRMYMEHQNLMQERLQYLCQLGLIDPALSEGFISAKKDADTAYLLSLKYQMTRNRTHKESCIKTIFSSLDTNKAVLPQVVNQLI